ncbi:MAG: glycosyl hydrolase family 18 protein [Planctomycetota bacterium]|nr:glycosyl hydrolase family 18 protein [Planctomycetota bacterium]
MRFVVDSAWSDGYNAHIEIENTGASAIDGWELSYADGPEISSLWNADWQVENGRTVLSNLDWNGTILPGAIAQIGFGGVGTFVENVNDTLFNGVPISVQYGSDEDPGGDAGGESGEDASPQPDLSGDGAVDGADLAMLLAAWGSGDPAFDLDGDGSVAGGDLTILLAAWSPGGNDSDGGGTGPSSDKKVVGYYIEWGIYGRDYQPADMPLDKLTHVNYAFANISADGRIAIGDPYAAIEKLYPGDAWDQPYAGTYNQLNNVLREQYPHIKTLISVGGWTWSGRFSDVALTEESRARFAQSCVEFIRQYNFDGVDLDWEYPVEGGLSSNTRRPEDGVNYTLLLQELRSQLDQAGLEDDRTYLLTIASPAGWDKVRHLDIEALSDVLDFINIMTYDFRGAWDLSTTAHHANFFENPDDPTDANSVAAKYNVNWVVNEFLDQGADPGKIVLGIPFYGRSWGGVSDPMGNGGLFQPGSLVPAGTWDDWSSGATGINDFTELEQMISSGTYTRYWDDVAKVPYLYSPTEFQGHFISYEDEDSLAFKLDFILEQELGGVMFWEVTADRNETLLDVIDSSFAVTDP